MNKVKDEVIPSHPGMSMRQYYKAAAIQGLCSSFKYQQTSNPGEVIKTAARIADMAVREDTGGQL